MDLLECFENDYGKLKPTERELFERFRKGEVANIGGTLPDKKTTDNVVRAVFIRRLLLSCSTSAHTGASFHLKGAFIEGALDLSGLTITVDVRFSQCRFTQPVLFRGTVFEGSVVFNGCSLKSFFGERIVVNGNLAFLSVQTHGVVNLINARITASLNCRESQFDGAGTDALVVSSAIIQTGVFLNKGFSAKGLVNFKSATIGGQFNCSSASFAVETGNALEMDSAVVNGSVLLQEGFSSTGTIRMLGVRIDGQICCQNSRFSSLDESYAMTLERGYIRNNALFSTGCEVAGTLYLLGLVVDGNLEFNDSSIEIIKASEIRVKGRLSLHSVKQVPKSISLGGAKVSFLSDDLRSWGDNPFFNGFVYDFIDVHRPMSVGERITWLKRQETNKKKRTGSTPVTTGLFRPQPWRQLQQVLESMGHSESAKEIGIEYEHCLRRFELIGQSPDNWNRIARRLYADWARLLHFVYGYLTGFGYRPMLLLPWFALAWGLCAFIYWGAASAGIFAPSNPLIFQNEAYETCRPDREQVWLSKRHDRLRIELPPAYTGAGNWYLCEALREEYTGFSPVAFSLDLLLPLVDLHQENDWAPLIATPKSNWLAEAGGFFSAKRLVRFVMWCEILAGWGFSLLFVAVVSGLARRKE